MKAVALSLVVFVYVIGCSDAPSAPSAKSSVQFVSVSAGETHACALDKTGHVWCWGANRSGEIGVPMELCGAVIATVCLEPARMIADNSFTAVVAGSNFSCALKTDGRAYCWGADSQDQLGVSPRASLQCDISVCSDKPMPVSGGFAFKRISAGMFGACAITIDGIGKCWGSSNGVKLLGNPSTVFTSATPLSVVLSTSNDSSWDEIDHPGYYSNCGVVSALHTVACWGTNFYGQLGLGDIPTGSGAASPPRPVAAPVPLHGVAAGDVNSCALDDTNAAYCWGSSTNGIVFVEAAPAACGPSVQPYNCYPTPSKLKTAVRFSSLTAGSQHFCGIAVTTGDAYCWGQNRYGQIGLAGLPQATSYSEPTAVIGGLHFKSLSAGADFTCGVSTTGDVWCWGVNFYGQLGYGNYLVFSTLAYGPLRLFPATDK
jgi:alpha-tubulin suppressor-like RCC1 family protein